ncbi:phage membrane protein [Proteus mirabilis]|uniref:Phage membrane protein n=1 Tax=Proteus mirabilis TaxID=584 RepID=A0A379FFT7_PROMI|nr:phage membrane protein [Proteus mirabilis]
MIDLFKLTKKSSRHIGIAIYVGIIAGIFSALVKSGFEDLIPPRTLETTPPPVRLTRKAWIKYRYYDLSLDGI